MLKLIPPVDNHVPAYPIAAELASSEIHRIQKCVTIISNQRLLSNRLPVIQFNGFLNVEPRVS